MPDDILFDKDPTFFFIGSDCGFVPGFHEFTPLLKGGVLIVPSTTNFAHQHSAGRESSVVSFLLLK
jgi:hypothetical protein